MDRLRSVPLLLVLALLFPLGATMPIACCAGVAVGAHGQSSGADHCGGGRSCCDRAAEDAAARHCCAGGDAFERPLQDHRPTLDADAVAAAVYAAAPAQPWSVATLPSPRDPVPRLEPLYTLHSSLLI